jgi:DNA-directed RNA polymerase subunit RPC12/RpoP
MSVTTIISCPECEKKFKGRPELKGKKVRCPACGHTFVVETIATDQVAVDSGAKPAPKAPASAKAGPAPGIAPEAPIPFAADDEEDEYSEANPYGVTLPDLAPRCPNCANELESADAIVCLYCGYNTQSREIGKTEKVYQTTGGEQFMWLLPGLASVLAIVLLTAFCLFFCLELPDLVQKNWMSFLDHESMRMWITMIAMAMMWPAGYFAHKRLILQSRAPEKSKD